MKCPVCENTNLLMSERQGIEIDYCPQCRGVWLDRGELDKIIERSGVASSAAAGDVVNTMPAAAPAVPSYPTQAVPQPQPQHQSQHQPYPQQHQPYPQPTQHYSSQHRHQSSHTYPQHHHGGHYKKKKEGFLSDLFDFD
ncbi:zf-TFIIB domain-containing protein [Undibacterium baiyunense]|uniref:Zf-TFIIB domain-containing protein n=1 Tax=Undibacterium baiyunense TaxID=2828731 RepID=A0A941I4D7_9BURK|nr:zf-TFIIB domain-containing protein [Undibacterium baiyunense]